MPIENRPPDVTIIEVPSHDDLAPREPLERIADSLERIADSVEEIASRLPAADS
jgi:hypothetical protein